MSSAPIHPRPRQGVMRLIVAFFPASAQNGQNSRCGG